MGTKLLLSRRRERGGRPFPVSGLGGSPRYHLMLHRAHERAPGNKAHPAMTLTAHFAHSRSSPPPCRLLLHASGIESTEHGRHGEQTRGRKGWTCCRPEMCVRLRCFCMSPHYLTAEMEEGNFSRHHMTLAPSTKKKTRGEIPRSRSGGTGRGGDMKQRHTHTTSSPRPEGKRRWPPTPCVMGGFWSRSR